MLVLLDNEFDTFVFNVSLTCASLTCKLLILPCVFFVVLNWFLYLLSTYHLKSLLEAIYFCTIKICVSAMLTDMTATKNLYSVHWDMNKQVAAPPDTVVLCASALKLENLLCVSGGNVTFRWLDWNHRNWELSELNLVQGTLKMFTVVMYNLWLQNRKCNCVS